MSDKFVILHLSDTHIGHPDHSVNSLTVIDPLFDDLKDMSKIIGSVPSLIVFSGDLVYGELPEKKISEQYKEAEQFLRKLYSCFGKGYGDIPTLIVPGNHDINRSLIDEAQKQYRESYTEDIVKKLMLKKDTTWMRIIERQKQWSEFVKTIPNQGWMTIDPDLYSICGNIHHSGKKIGLVGLNTCWASHEQNEQSKLWVGEFQYEKSYQTIKDAEFKIIVSHHPLHWLHSEERNSLAGWIELQFDIYLHGHEHGQWFNNEANKRLKSAAGACYDGSKKPNGYSWLEIDFTTSSGRIYLREYDDKGARGWRPNHILDKTNEHGISDVFFKGACEQLASTPTTIHKQNLNSLWPTDLVGFIKTLEDRFSFRWEKGNLQHPIEKPLIYWPVRLRKPTPIHAAQCFVAAGLQKMGCKITLWIDDLGRTDYPSDKFISSIKTWYKKVGGDDSELVIRQFGEIINGDNKHIEPAWGMLQKWLGNSIFMTDHILKISKLWPTTEDPAKEDPTMILEEIKSHRARRLMTPSMVWTCLSVLHQESETLPIITLGGYDEQGLWDAWRRCCSIPEMPVGHLYISKLIKGEQVVRMSDEELAWDSKEDIERTFTKTTSSDDSNMIEWTVNNCVLLPNYVSQRSTILNINGKQINTLNDIRKFKPNDIMHDAAEEVNSWLF